MIRGTGRGHSRGSGAEEGVIRELSGSALRSFGEPPFPEGLQLPCDPPSQEAFVARSRGLAEGLSVLLPELPDRLAFENADFFGHIQVRKSPSPSRCAVNHQSHERSAPTHKQVHSPLAWQISDVRTICNIDTYVASAPGFNWIFAQDRGMDLEPQISQRENFG